MGGQKDPHISRILFSLCTKPPQPIQAHGRLNSRLSNRPERLTANTFLTKDANISHTVWHEGETIWQREKVKIKCFSIKQGRMVGASYGLEGRFEAR